MRRICSVCSKLDPHFYESLEDLTKELLEFLLINVNFTGDVLCAGCKENIFQSFEFKGKCILTNDMLYPYIKDTHGTKIDLKTIYFKIVKLEGNKTLKNLKICRLCLIEMNNNSYDLSEDVLAKYGIDRFFFRNFIPEVNLDSIESPCMCEICMQSLLRFAKFVERLGTVDKSRKIPGETEKVPNELNRSAKKDAITKLQSYSDKSKEPEPRLTPPPKKKPAKHKFSCEKCTYTTPLRRDIVRHFDSRHAKTKCPHCAWAADSKFALRMHIRKRHQANKCQSCDLFFTTASRLRCHLAETHKTSDRIYRCAECGFACTQRSSLNRHALRHADAVKRHVCDVCGFSAVFGHNLAKHKLVHQKADREPLPPPPSEGVHRCRLCSFTTKDKKTYSEHLYVHKYFSVTSEGYFKCVKCDFVNERMKSLRQHALVHLKMRRRDKVKASNRIFDCDRCDFVTIYAESWRRHIDVHSSQRVNFRCNDCPYVSKYRGNLAKHLVKHRQPEEGKKAAEAVCQAEEDSKGYFRRCSVCSFKAKNRSTYTRHLRVYGH